MTRVGIITQARMTSTRLPGKVLMTAGGTTMLAHHIDRLSAIDVPIIVATTMNSTDDPVVEAALQRGAQVFRGSEHDVLSRFADAAIENSLDVVVRVTSDCPLIDPALVQHGIDQFNALADPFAHVSNVLERTYPRGFDFEVFSAEALLGAATSATDPSDREHVTPYLYSSGARRSNLHSVRRDGDASHFRVTLDTGDDLALITALIERYDAADHDAEGIIAVLEAHPEIAQLNAQTEQKRLGE